MSRLDLVLVFFMIFALALSFSILFYIALVIAPKILTTEVNLLPININGVYPILLQGLIIAASIVMGFFAVLLSRLIPDSVNFVETEGLSQYWEAALYIIVSVVALLLLALMILSIFYSVNSSIYYGRLDTYIVQTSSEQIPNLVMQNLSIVIMNNSYFNSSIYKNYTGSINQTYTHLTNSTKMAISSMFSGFILLLFSILLYIFIDFKVLKLFRKAWARGPIDRIVILFIFISVSSAILNILKSTYFVFYVVIVSVIGIVFTIITICIWYEEKKFNKAKIVFSKKKKK